MRRGMKSGGLIQRQTEEQESHVLLWKKWVTAWQSGMIGRNVFVRWSYTSVLKTWLSQLSVFPRAERHPSTDTSLTWWRSRQKSSFLRIRLSESQKLCDSFPHSWTLPRIRSLHMCRLFPAAAVFNQTDPSAKSIHCETVAVTWSQQSSGSFFRRRPSQNVGNVHIFRHVFVHGSGQMRSDKSLHLNEHM